VKGAVMVRKMFLICPLVFAFLLFGAGVTPAFAQELNPVEMSSNVPQLADFHEVIYQIWHEAWPQKNTEMLKGLIPEIDSGYINLSKAKLSPLLHEKQSKWTEGITVMGEIIAQYKAAAATADTEALLKAAEKLHSQYEVLVRTIRPALKEMDNFHQELYMLYHYYILEYNFDTIAVSAEKLAVRMAALNQAELPKKHKTKLEQFNQSRQELSTAVDKLNQAIKDKADKETVLAAVEVVHTDYQKLTAVFE
jgi:hypothetical protein